MGRFRGADTSCRSLCPTFAAVGAFINNARWDDVPFLLKAGKALHSKRAEIRVQFRHVPGNLYRDKLGIDLDRSTNELVTSFFICQCEDSECLSIMLSVAVASLCPSPE